MATPGVLFVYMRPKPHLSLDRFHDWYNNEHGPNRLRLPHIFSNGLRYRASDGLDPAFLAVYDVTDMAYMTKPVYTDLRENRTPREAETIAEVDVDRRFYDLVLSKQSPLFMPIEKLDDDEAKGINLVVRHTTLKDVDGAEEQYRKWFEEEHVEMVSKIPGWLRSRWFKTSSIEDAGKLTYLAMHEYTEENGLGGPEYQAATSTPRRNQVMYDYVQDVSRRTFSLFYVFSPCPRDLSSLSKMSVETPDFSSADAKTKTTAGPAAAIDSYATTSDGLAIPYRMEGNPSPDAPVVAFSNSLLTSMHMWDNFILALKSNCPDLRILRYDTRGRHSIPHPPVGATADLLADDLVSLLDALRIPVLHTLIGVSMGGLTTVKFALKYPDRVAKFVGCDFNATSSPANTQAWKDRIAVAEEDNGQGIKKLAEATVGRWFHPSTMENKETTDWMIDMVGTNDVEGFKYSCQALWDYDLKPQMPRCKVPGILVVGEGDGKGALVKAMDGFRGQLGPNGTELRIVPNTGHLPMSEDPDAFWDTIQDFL